jgi:hypothetical protein
MSPVLEDITPEAAQVLVTQAKARGLSIDAYLKKLLGMVNGGQLTARPTLAEFEADMEALSEDTAHLPTEPLLTGSNGMDRSPSHNGLNMGQNGSTITRVRGRDPR